MPYKITNHMIQFDRNDRKTANTTGLGLTAAGVAVGATALDKKVGISYGYDGKATRGHLSQAEDIKKVLSESGIKSTMHSGPEQFKGITRPAMVQAGHGPPLPFAEQVPWRSDYAGVKNETTMPIVRAKPGPISKAGKKTIGVYGGGAGMDVVDKLHHISQALDDSIHSVHVYAGSKRSEAQQAVSAMGDAGRKFKVHGPMKRKAIMNAVDQHHINIGNAGLSTAHEIATSGNRGIIWQAGPRVGASGEDYPHLARNEDWARKRGVAVPHSNDEAVETIKGAIKGNDAGSVAEKITKEGEASRQSFVKDVRAAIHTGRKNRIIAGAGIAAAGAGVLAATHVDKIRSKQNHHTMSTRLSRLVQLNRNTDKLIQLDAPLDRQLRAAKERGEEFGRTTLRPGLIGGATGAAALAGGLHAAGSNYIKNHPEVGPVSGGVRGAGARVGAGAMRVGEYLGGLGDEVRKTSNDYTRNKARGQGVLSAGRDSVLKLLNRVKGVKFHSQLDRLIHLNQKATSLIRLSSEDDDKLATAAKYGAAGVGAAGLGAAGLYAAGARSRGLDWKQTATMAGQDITGKGGYAATSGPNIKATIGAGLKRIFNGAKTSVPAGAAAADALPAAADATNVLPGSIKDKVSASLKEGAESPLAALLKRIK